MQHQIIMQLHHQRHQRTLQPNVNVNINGLKMNRHINNPSNVNRNEVVPQMNMQYKKRIITNTKLENNNINAMNTMNMNNNDETFIKYINISTR